MKLCALGLVAFAFCGSGQFPLQENAQTSSKHDDKLRSGKIVEFLVVGPFDGAMNKKHWPETDSDPARRVDLATGQATETENARRWRPHHAGANGVMDLAPLFSAPRSSAYALAYVFSPEEQPAKLHIDGSAVARYWLNGGKLLDFAPCCGAEPIPVTLQKGVNRVLVRVFATKEDMSFSLRITDARDLRFSLRPTEK